MRYIVRIGELGKKIDFLEDQLTTIDETIDSLNKVKSTIIWEGEASMAFSDKYDTYILELTMIAKNILEIIKYLVAYYDKYGNRYSLLRQKYAKYFEEVEDGTN